MVSDTGPFFRHGTINWIVSSLRLLWSRWFPSTYVLFYYLTCVITRDMVSRCRVLTSAHLVTLLLRLDVLLLSHFILFFSLCFNLHVCCLSGSARSFGVSHLMIDSLLMSPSCFTVTFVVAECPACSPFPCWGLW